MNIKAADCPNCGARLQIDKQKELAHCEYCGKDYFLHNNKIEPQILSNENSQKEPEEKSSEETDEETRFFYRLFWSFIVFVMILIAVAYSVYNKPNSTPPVNVSSDFRSFSDYSYDRFEEIMYTSLDQLSTPIKEFIAAVKNKNSDRLVVNDFESFTYLKIEESANIIIFSYSFSKVVFGTDEFLKSIKTVNIPVDSMQEIRWRDIYYFTGLVALDLSQFAMTQESKSSLEPFINLKHYQGSKNQTLSQIEMTASPMSQILTLRICIETQKDIEACEMLSNLISLEINDFDNDLSENEEIDEEVDFSVFGEMHTLRSLQINSPVTDISVAAAFPNLKELRLENCREIQLYDALSNMKNLEKLSLHMAVNLKDINFASGLDKLQDVELTGSAVKNLESLENKVSVRRLSLVDNFDLTHADAILSLINLQELELRNLKWNTENLSLSHLENLKSVVTNYANFSIVENNIGLQNLQIEWGVNNYANFDCEKLANFTELEDLQLKDGFVENASVLSGLPKLKKLYLEGVNISDSPDNHLLFNSSSIVDLALHKVSMIFDETKIQPNLVLKNLTIRESSDLEMIRSEESADDAVPEDNATESVADNTTMAAHTSESGINGISPEESGLEADTESSVMPENVIAFDMDHPLLFLQKFPELEFLSLIGCKITDIAPLGLLTSLRSIDLEDNQIVDLSPIKDLPDLEFVNCRNNPILETDVFSGEVEVYK